MKFIHTLIVNAKEIAVLHEAMKMYGAHIDQLQKEKKWGIFGEVRFNSYRAKVCSMRNVLDGMRTTEKSVVSESSVYEKSLFPIEDEPSVAPSKVKPTSET